MENEKGHGQMSEVHISNSGPSGWHSPENVKLLIEKLGPALEKIPDWLEGLHQASAQSAQVTRYGVISVIALICLGAVCAVLLDVYHGSTALAEKVLIPLISFAGGLGLSARIGK